MHKRPWGKCSKHLSVSSCSVISFVAFSRMPDLLKHQPLHLQNQNISLHFRKIIYLKNNSMLEKSQNSMHNSKLCVWLYPWVCVYSMWRYISRTLILHFSLVKCFYPGHQISYCISILRLTAGTKYRAYKKLFPPPSPLSSPSSSSFFFFIVFLFL